MGIADRDYTRVDTGGRGSRERFDTFAANPGPRAWSVNTWLIAINIAVFALTVLLFSTPTLLRPMFFTPVFEPGVTPRQARDAHYFPEAVRPGVPSQIIELYEVPGTTPDGAVVVDRFGRPAPVRIGTQQVAMVPWTDYWGHFSTARAFLHFEVWRFVSFQFLHASIGHLLMNMLGLWMFGALAEQFLGSKRYLAYYLTCGIFGAVAYLLLNFLGNYVFPNSTIPGLLVGDPATPLVGASAGIFGVLMAAAYISPRSIVHVFGLVPLQTRTAVYAFVGLAALMLLRGSPNAGGEAAHLGGAVSGYFFIRRQYLLRDFFDFFGRAAPNKGSPPTRGSTPPPGTNAEVDRVLAKVRAEGLGALTTHEKETLRRATAASQSAGAQGTPP
jgi:membrane associated rhomboid family serine protease